MEKLSCIQKETALNTVYIHDGLGGIPNSYWVELGETGESITLNFQKGPRKEKGSIQGLTVEDVLEIARNRLSQFNKGTYKTKDNENALTKVEEALMWLAKRKVERKERGVLGLNQE